MCFFCGISIICCTAGCSVSNGSEKETGYSKEQTSENWTVYPMKKRNQ